MNLKPLPKHVRVYEISGPMFFGATEQIAAIDFSEGTKVIIMRMRGVPAVDASAMHTLEEFNKRCTNAGIQLVFSHVNEQPMAAMQKSGFIDLIGKDNFRPHIDDAVEWAGKLVSEENK